MTIRADSAFYNKKAIGACRNADVRFSITVPLSRSIRAAIAAIPDKA